MKKPPKPPTKPKVRPNYAWAVLDRERVVEVSHDRALLPALGKGERLVRVQLVIK